MGPRRFVQANAADALRQIKLELGPEAIVLSNREVDGGIEFIAIGPEGLSSIASANNRSAAAMSSASAPASPLPALVSKIALSRFRDDQMRAERQFQSGPANPLPVAASVGAVFTPGAAPAPLAAEPAKPAKPVERQPDPEFNRLIAEMADVKMMLHSHLAGNQWGEVQRQSPSVAELTKRLLNAGLSPQLTSELLQDIPATADLDTLTDQVQARLEGMIGTIDPFSVFDQGGVFAFIGPTGVGKTTTVAKIAARCVLRYGRKEVALLTTDTFRAGAPEQLRVFAKILGLPIVSLSDSEEMNDKLKELSNRRVLLIDTAGVSQRDRLMIEQSRLLRDGCKGLQRIIVMSATTSLATMQDVLQAHTKAITDVPIVAAIITKSDEAIQMGPAVDCLVRNKLPLLFLANGQRVPEDLFPANPRYLAHRSVLARGHGSDTGLNDQQVSSMMMDNLADWAPKAGQ
jgi:flagellar biosynthesis protein FlhF